MNVFSTPKSCIMALKRRLEEASTPHTVPAPNPHQIWTCASPIYDRESTFKAYFSPSMPAQALRSHLKSIDDIESATHHMLAWRLPRPPQGTLNSHFQPTQDSQLHGTEGRPNRPLLNTGSDDDGERYGGRHVLRALEAEGVQGALVVARWYGGVMLGPVRFTHMEEIARQAIREWRRDTAGPGLREADDMVPKRAKTSTDAAKDEGIKSRLARELADRDANIIVLRELLKSKQAAASKTNGVGNGEKATVENSSQPETSPAKKIDYTAMTLDALRRADKARDSTVAFLLKKIEEAEAAEREEQEVDEALQSLIAAPSDPQVEDK